MQKQLASKTSKDLIIKEHNFLGFGRINTDQTITNFTNAFNLINTRLFEKNQQLETKNRQISAHGNRLTELKKELAQLKIKNACLLTDPAMFADEKKKYLNSVADTLEKKSLQSVAKSGT